MPGQKRVFAPDVPGIHVLAMLKRGKTWMAGTSPAMTVVGEARGPPAPRIAYCVTVCTTLLIGRLATAGTFCSLTSIASYSGRVSSCSLAFI